MSVDASAFRFASRYYITFRASNGTNVTALRGNTVPKLTGGWGGWEIRERRRRRAATSWTGREPLQMDLPILFDGWGIFPESVDADVQTLRLMATGDNFQEPPTVFIDGFTPAAGVKWVINNFEWGDDVKWTRDPQTGIDIRVRQDVIVQLVQFVEEDTVKVVPTAGVPGIWITQDGDTLRKISKTTYGNGKYWQQIAKANPGITRDPDAPLPPKLRLILPPLPREQNAK